MSWLWDIEDMYTRVDWARLNSPVDFYTTLARKVLGRVTWALAYALWPVDKVARLVGQGMIAVVLGLAVLMVLHALWMPFWGFLVGSSYLWIKTPAYRPLFVLPGIVIAIGAQIFLALVPDPHKEDSYFMMAREWPLTWHLWRPPPAYFEETGVIPM